MIADLGPYAEYKDSGVPWLGDVPAHWDIRRIKTVLREATSRTPDGQGTLLALTRSRGLIPRSDSTARVASASTLVGYKHYKPTQIVMNRMQAWSGMFGLAAISGLVSPDYAVFDVVQPQSPSFMLLRIKTPDLVGQFAIASRGIGSGFNRLYTDKLGAVWLALPPPDEQAAIVRFLDWATRRVDRAIRAKRRLVALLTEQKQAIIHRAVTQGLDPSVPMKASGIPWLGEIPAHWEVRRIGAFARVGNGSTPARSNPSYWRGGHYPWLNSSQVHRGVIGSADQFVTTRALAECHLPRLSYGAVLIAITGQGKTRGTAAILAMDATINQHIAYIIPSGSIVSSAYLQSYLQASYVALRAMSEDAGSTKGAITCRDLKSFGIAVPPMSQQAAIVAHLDDATAGINSTIERTQRQIGLLREYRARLVADVVTGKLDVRAFAETLPDEAPDDIEAVEADVDEDADDDETGDGADEG